MQEGLCRILSVDTPAHGHQDCGFEGFAFGVAASVFSDVGSLRCNTGWCSAAVVTSDSLRMGHPAPRYGRDRQGEGKGKEEEGEGEEGGRGEGQSISDD